MKVNFKPKSVRDRKKISLKDGITFDDLGEVAFFVGKNNFDFPNLGEGIRTSSY